jgi:hypothetical protein
MLPAAVLSKFCVDPLPICEAVLALLPFKTEPPMVNKAPMPPPQIRLN